MTLFVGVSNTAYAQPEDNDVTESNNTIDKKPRDNFYDRYLHKEQKVIDYDFIHEKDVFWEKRIWRLIDVREKMNHPFIYEKQYFFKILMDGVEKGDIVAYNEEDFSKSISGEDVLKAINLTDTVEVFNPETYDTDIQVVTNELNASDVKQYRLKEVWYFDEETSRLGVRILGIAPLYEKKDDNGNVLGTMPLFWVYYPDIREVLARYESFNDKNDAQRMSWEDVFEARLFSSYIIKESNVFDRYIKQYKPNTADQLFEAEKIKDGMFHFEHDLWEY
jgi:gliding motility associated protien GldN